MPSLWSDTIEAHRREVRDAVMDTTARLAREHGPLNLTMTQVAEAAGIGRATLYKYFDSIETILHAWHQRRISDHLDQLIELAERDDPPLQQLENVLQTYATIQRHRSRDARAHGADLAALLHRGPELAPVERQLHELLRGLVAAAADARQIRSDIPPAELATFCLHALDAAGRLDSDTAVERLVEVALTGLRPTT